MINLRFVRSFILVSGLALCTTTLAQTPLSELAPADTAVAVTFGSGGNPFAQVRDDLSELDWHAAGETLRSVLAAADAELEELSGLLEGSGHIGILEAALADTCPQLRQPLLELADGGLLPPMEGLVALEVVGVLPAVTGVVRLESASAGELQAIRSALGDCASTVMPTEASTGTVDIYYLGAGSPVTATVTDDGLVVVASAPRLVLDVLSRNSQPEGSSSLLATFDRFERSDSYLGLAIRPAAFIDAVEVLVGTSADDQALLAKITATLETVETVSGQWSADGSATVSEWAVEVDPNGPDRALVQLLLCDACLASTPFLVPDGAIGVSSSRFPVEDLFGYLESWFAVSGEPANLRTALQSELGIDIDRDLLDWLGSELHAAVLGPVGTDLSTLIYGPGQLFMIPVTSEADAAAGLDRIERALEEPLAEVTTPEFPVAVRTVEYRGFEYDRIQASFNLDLGLGLVGNHLVLATPAEAIEAVIDTFLGEPGLVSRSTFRDAVASTPREAQAVWLQENSAHIEGLADLLRLAAQPVAFGLHIAATSLEASSTEELSELWPVSTGDAEPEPLLVRAPQVVVEGSLDESSGDPYVEDELSDLYRLEGLEPGDEVTVVVESDEFDTVVSLIESQRQMVLAYNDDAPDTSRSEIAFTYQEGLDLLVQVTSFGGAFDGSYRLTVDVQEAGAEAQAEVEPPSFGDILAVTELPAEVLEVLAAHVGTTIGYTVTDGNVIYTRSETELR